MGLNKNTKTPCGFCFVEYFIRDEAANAIDQLNNSYLDNRQIRVDWDMGFVEGRQYGRGFSGAQKRDELADIDDPDRPRDNKFIPHKKRYRDYGNNNRDRDRDDNYRGRDYNDRKQGYNNRRNNQMS